MSNDVAGQTAQPNETQAAANAHAVEQYFSRVAASGPQPRLRSVSGTCQFDIAGAGTWRVSIKDGTPTVTQGGGDLATADCVVSCTTEDFLRVLHREGHLNMLAAFLQGLVTITGDVSFAAAVLGSATVEPVGTTGAQPR